MLRAFPQPIQQDPVLISIVDEEFCGRRCGMLIYLDTITVLSTSVVMWSASFIMFTFAVQFSTSDC
eukprot:NODE_10962_length_292_cov_1.531646.p3 GENE.NODE_10962_length_292_cov_1.531646~~NODE_10962_length_292_cov_1.531646.p3  ORF type:complete len:66 (-),score=17.12 NODE_10962_length_292_cov_1.531646:17-214(-)